MNKAFVIFTLVLCGAVCFGCYDEFHVKRCKVKDCYEKATPWSDLCMGHDSGKLPMPGDTTATTTTEVTTCEVEFGAELSTEEQKENTDNIGSVVAAEKATETTTYSYNYSSGYSSNYGNGYSNNYSSGYSNNYGNSYNHHSYNHHYYEPEPDEGEVYDFYHEHRNEFKSYEDAYEAYEDDIDYWDEDYDDWDDWDSDYGDWE